MSYEISPDPAFFPMSIGSAVAAPDLRTFRLSLGIPQKSQIAPALVYFPLMRGEKITVDWQILTGGIPGTTTPDWFWPEDTKPQMRISLFTTPDPVEIVVMLYHGEPGVLRGDDNWSQENPSIQPQLRTNTIPHTEDPALVDGTWRVNEVFLPPAPD